MGKTIFKFDSDSEKSDIELCAHRWELFEAISEIRDLLRELRKNAYCRQRYMYPIGTSEDEFGRPRFEYATLIADEHVSEKDAVAFIEVDKIIGDLEEALEDVKDTIWRIA